jgi:uncharacterized protein (DUF433 family)
MGDQDETITSSPGVLGGKPVIRGTRISVELICELLDASWSDQQIVENYPHVTQSDIAACRDYSHRNKKTVI